MNACYWALRIEEKLDSKSDVAIFGDCMPTQFGFGKAKAGVMARGLPPLAVSK